MGYKSESLGTAPWPRATLPARHHVGVRVHGTRVTPAQGEPDFVSWDVPNMPQTKGEIRPTPNSLCNTFAGYTIMLHSYDNVPLHDTLDLQFRLNYCSPSQIL